MKPKMERHLFTEGSRGDWGIKLQKDEAEMLLAPENFLRDGALLRIADALELLTKDKAEVQRETEHKAEQIRILKIDLDQAEVQGRELSVERHRCAALRGYIARMKKQAKKA